MRCYQGVIAGLVAFVLVGSSTASADTIFTPYLGSTFAANFGGAEPPGNLSMAAT